MGKSSSEGDLLNPKQRAEDILLGSLGFAEEASLVEIQRSQSGFKGRVRFADGEEIEIENTDETSELEEWALKVLLSSTTPT